MNDNTAHHTDCCVVGGGPAGLVLALLLARNGRPVTVIDKREHLDREGASHEPFLSPPSLELLDRMGLLSAFAQEGQPVRAIHEHRLSGGHSTVEYASVPGSAAPYALSVPLRAMTRILLDALDREPLATVMPGTGVEGLDIGDEGVVLSVERGGAPGRVECRRLIANDGKFSALRNLAGIEADVRAFDRPLIMAELPLPGDWPERITAHRDALGTLLATMPVAGGLLTVMWAADPEEWKQVRSRGVQALRERLAPALPGREGLLEQHVTDWDQVAEIHHHVIRPVRWQRGPFALMGDSAHGVHSLGAQGLNLAFLDAVALADLLTDPLRDTGREPFADYELLRRPPTERFQTFQLTLGALSSRPRTPVRHEGLYTTIAETLALGRPEVTALYERVVARHDGAGVREESTT
ncbi:FAD-dependent oxidoreductase [Streptomyces sp. NPDC059256]|uniref:FAD-dependent oxidoreductase n=1 Tax=Streptomyces sp. NPDC059256 TaxID=3346794 RepID=UPI0036BAA076